MARTVDLSLVADKRAEDGTLEFSLGMTSSITRMSEGKFTVRSHLYGPRVATSPKVRHRLSQMCSYGWNTPPSKMEDFNPVSRLPVEVLAQIFIHNILLLPAQRGHYYRLFNTLFVCWRWYKITISTPHLWYHLGSNINLWPLFARRSKKHHLFIHMYDITG